MFKKIIFKYLYIILCLISINIFSQNYSGNYRIEKIYRIEKNNYILLISNKNIKGFIASDNPNLKIDSKSVKIKLNYIYRFQLTLDTTYYRTRNPSDGFGVLLKNGKFKTIWQQERDGILPLIFSSSNVKGLYLKNQ